MHKTEQGMQDSEDRRALKRQEESKCQFDCCCKGGAASCAAATCATVASCGLGRFQTVIGSYSWDCRPVETCMCCRFRCDGGRTTNFQVCGACCTCCYCCCLWVAWARCVHRMLGVDTMLLPRVQ